MTNAVSQDTLILARSVLYSESRTLRDLAEGLDESFLDAVDSLSLCEGRVILCGMGKAGLIGKKIAATFSSTGTPSFFLHPAEAIHGDLGAVRSGDVVLLLSHSGRTEEILRLLPSLRELGAKMIAMTDPKSPLALEADGLIPLVTEEEADPLSLAPSNSTTAMLALGDALAFCLASARGFRSEEFARFHPGGALGLALSVAGDKMRPLAECRTALVSRTIREAFVESRIPGRRSGAILLLGEEGELAGLFTDSDLVKLFERKDESFLDRPAMEFMTRHPKTVLAQTPMSEVMRILASNKISEIPVLDDASRPIGLIDITDLV